MQRRLPWLRRLALPLALALSLPMLGLWYVGWATAGQRYERTADVPPVRVAIVFGAGLAPSGRPSPFLADRVRAAADLYRAGRVQKLLMTGDNSRADYDEVSAMRGYALSLGVPEGDITLDYAGFDTYDSCYRAGPIFGVDDAVLITQRYHLPRAVYLCRALGIHAVGLATPDWERYHWRIMVPYMVREALASIKALWEVHLTRPLPTFLGPYEGIS
jgi:vancomycin permeability regulator SanA